MIRNDLAWLTGSKRSFLALLASGALFTAGCSNMSPTATESSPVSSDAVSIGGNVHGGSQPVSGATVTMYFAGQSSPATVAATAASLSNGSFSFIRGGAGSTGTHGPTYNCPVTGDPLVYIIARGGNTVNDGIPTDVNSAAAFIGIYGTCNEITTSSSLELNEVTTVATMLAAQQYFNPVTEGLVSDGTGSAKIAIDNTLNTIALLANTTTGTTVSSTSIPGNAFFPSVTVTATSEASKVNLLANIITSCVNNISSSSSVAANCATLFASAPPPAAATTNQPGVTFPQPTDVLQALYYMLTNPTSGSLANRTALFGLASGAAAAFQPALATQPSDWTVAITYASSSTCGTGTMPPAFLNSPNSLAIDLDGNLWIANGQTGNSNYVELSNSGVATWCNTATAGTTPANGAVFIDSTGNVWTALSGSTTITRWDPNTFSSVTATAPAAVLAISGDGNGNVYFTTAAGLYEFAGGATAATLTVPSTPVSSLILNAVSLMPDTAGSIWASSGIGTLSQLANAATSPVLNLFTTLPDTQSVAVTNANNVFVSLVTPGNNITYFTNPGTGYVVQSGFPTTTSLGGINQPVSIALDGAQNLWAANHSANTNSLFGVSEISILGTALSPDTAAGGFQKSAGFLGAANSLMVDQSGNVWVLGGTGSSSFVTEIVGAGVPIYQPYAEGLKVGRFQSHP